jgi:raffinose/stachyose/melibiose transport system substrate-binding protein
VQSRLSRRAVLKGGVSLGAFAMFGPLLSACNGASDTVGVGNSESPSGTSAPQRRTRVVYWTWAHITAFPGYENNDIIKERFEDEHPQYELDVRFFTYPDYVAALQTSVPQQEAGHVLALQPGSMIRQYAPFLLSLGDFASDWFGSEWEEGYVRSAVDILRNSSPDGASYFALPSQLNVLGTQWYNADVFQQFDISVPRTYDELVEVGAALRAEDIIPIAWGAGDGWQNRDYLTTFASQFRPRAFEDAEAGVISFTDESIVQAFEHMKRTIDDDLYNRGPFGTTAYPEAMDMFWQKRAAMVNTGLHNHGSAGSVPDSVETWRAFTYPPIPGAPRDEWDSDLPQGVPAGPNPGGSRPIVDVAVSHGVANYAEGAERDGALAFVRWISSEEIQDWLSWWRTPSWASLSITGLEDAPEEYREMLDWHFQIAPFGERREFFYPEISAAVEEEVEQVMVGGASIDEALARLDQVAEDARSA